MDYSGFRRSDNIDVQGPIGSAWDNYWSSRGWSQDPFSQQIGKAQSAFQNVSDAFTGGDQTGNPNTKYDEGSLQDQAGANSDYFNDPTQQDGPAPQGDVPDMYGDQPTSDSDPNEYEGQQGYADGGAIDDGRDIPKGTARDPQTNRLDDAMQTIDDVMQHGYKINGLTGQSPGPNPESAIPDPVSDAGNVTGLADGGAVPSGAAPQGGWAVNPGTTTPAASQPQTTSTTGGSGFNPNFGGGAPMAAPRAASGGGYGRGYIYSHGPGNAGYGGNTNFMTQPGTSGNSGALGSHGAPMAFDDGGAIPDDQDQDQPQQPQQNDPNGGWQGGIPTMGQVGQAMKGTPSPAAPFEAPVKRIMNLIQGGGAMPIEQSQQLERASGVSDPNAAKIFTTDMLAKSKGPDAAWSYLQSLRKQYDLNRTNAAVKATQGNIAQSTIAANHAMTNVLDGTDTRFMPVQGGVRVVSQKLSQPKAKRYDDGGPVDDANGNEAQPAIPDDANGNQAQPAEGNKMIDTVLSIPQYLQMLRGKMGQYDQIWNNGIAGALKEAAKGLAGQGGPPQQQFPGVPQKSAALGEGAEGGAPLGSTSSNEIGTEEEDPQESLRQVPMPQSRPAEAPQAAAAPAAGAAAAPAAAAPQPEGRSSPFSKESEQQAWRLYPNIFGDAGKRAEYVRSQGEEAQKHSNEMEKTNAIWNSKKDISSTVGQNKITIQDLKNAQSNRDVAAKMATALQVAAVKSGSAADQNMVRLANGYLASGQTLPPELAQKVMELQNRTAAADEQRGSGPVQIQTPGNPNAQQPQQAQQRVVLVNNKPYYVDASGKVLGPAQ